MNMHDLATLPLPLTPVEREQLSDYEATIQRGLDTFYEVAAAFVHIKQRKLYRAEYRTFEEYCQKKWNVDRRYADRMIEAAEVRDNLGPIGPVLPEKESQARALVGLEPDQQRQVWAKAVETAPNGKLTAQHIKDVRQVEIPIPEPTPEPAPALPKQVSVFIPTVCTPQRCDICKRRYVMGDLPTLPDGRLECFDCRHIREEREERAERDALKDRETPDLEIEEQIIEVYDQIDKDLQAIDDDREPEAVIKDELELEPADQAFCDFCKEDYPNDRLYGGNIFGICRSCAAKALSELLDRDDPDAVKDASLQDTHFHSSDRDKIMHAGLRLFRAVDEELKPGQRVRELKEYTPTGAKDGNPLMGSWKRIETFPTTAALKRRIAELEHDERIIFESHLP